MHGSKSSWRRDRGPAADVRGVDQVRIEDIAPVGRAARRIDQHVVTTVSPQRALQLRHLEPGLARHEQQYRRLGKK